MKGKKRDREDPSFEPIKRGRNLSADDVYMQIARVAESGGLADPEAVAKLVRLMQPEKSQRKIDLAGRSMLAGIIAATDKLDYLRQFIQLKGLVILDEWLQEIHKGKFGESRNVKDSDKSVENFILVLLCALFKLPVNLNALQMCNIGKSVNYLRSHKNSEIQKKARNLVDTWKKRVEAEMSVNDTKSITVSSLGRSRDGSHGIGGHHSSLKSSSMKVCVGDSNLKSGSIYKSNVRSPLPQTVVKEEKTVGVHKEIASNRSTVVEKKSDNVIDDLVNIGNVHEGHNHKLIVKIPNRVRIPAQSIVPVSTDESRCKNDRASSPLLAQKHVKSEVCLMKSDHGSGSLVTEQPQTNDIKNDMQLKKANKSSFKLMNALIEICVEFLEADVPMSAGDEIGINLLASVAIGEFSSIALPAVSSQKSSTTSMNSNINCNGDEKHLHGDDDCNLSSILKINDGESGQHLDINHECLHRKEENPLRDNGSSDIKVEFRNQLLCAESIASDQGVVDKVKDTSLYDKSERTALMDIAYPSNIKDEPVKTEECKIDTFTKQNSHSVSFKSESRVTDEMSARSSRRSRCLDSVNTTIIAENTASVEQSDHADGKVGGSLVQENGSSQILEKQRDHGVHGADLPENLCSSPKEARIHGFDLNEDVNVDEGINAELTEAVELPLCPSEMPHPDGVTSKQARPLLDFDLNVANENFDPEPNFEQNLDCKASLHSSGGFNLDLNITEGEEMVHDSNSNAIRTLPSDVLTSRKSSGKRDFDLNDGPALEEVVVDQISYSQPACNNVPLQSSFGPAYYNPNAGNIFAKNPPRTSYSVSVTPSVLPGREAFPVVGISGGPHQIMAGPSSNVLFYPDTYRESMLSSFPTMPFQSTPFQYPVFPFLQAGASGYMDPTASGRISAFPTQLGGNAPPVSFQYPYVVSRPIPEVGFNEVFDRNQHMGKQGLDLNSAPRGVDLDGTYGSMPTVSRQVSAASSQPRMEEQAMMYRLGGGGPKRKEPNGGSDMDELNFKQSSWWR